MRNTKLACLVFSCMAFMFSSCEKPEGEGGKSAIEGKVYKINEAGDIAKNANGQYYFIKDTIVAVDEDVFIIYGADVQDFYGDKASTDYNGKFRFEYLVSGNYSVYAYTNNADETKTAVIRSVKIDDSGTSNVEDIYIQDGKNVGLSAIVGNIQAKGNYTGGAIDARVFLREMGVVGPIQDTRTDDNGDYVFTRLSSGRSYEVWAESLSKKNGVSFAVKDTVNLPEKGMIAVADVLTIGIY
ncbi:MAG TPA: hypothetical protein PKW49_04125 [Paludibacteraceae bacterium]|nr:hypothetical protein [Paludibacteraceae bacterium]HQF49752.1 hypothetical protein [Paludibacteraceae bacterium]